MEDRFFWDDPLRDDPDAPRESRGISLTAPRVVPIVERATFPVVARHTATLGEKLAGADFRARGIVTAIDVERNVLFAGFAMDREGLEPSESEPVDDPEVLAATITAPYVMELRERLALPWGAGEYLVTAMLGGAVSNRVRVRLGAPAAAYDDPEVARYLAGLRGKAPPQGVSPPEGRALPSYEKLPASPDIPSSPGIALDVDADLTVRGAFHIASRPEDFAAKGAIVDLHLLVVGDDEAIPLPIALRVPSPDAAREAAFVSGYFAVALPELIRLPYRSDAYRVHAFARDVIASAPPRHFAARRP